MSGARWLDELMALARRYSGYGIGPDLAGMTLAEAWAVYRFLSRLAAGE